MKKYIILIPLYNDWKSVSKLLMKIDEIVNNWNAEVSVIIVNDASTEEKSGLDLKYKKIQSVKILNMKENRVHQRWIAAGLKYICKKENFKWFTWVISYKEVMLCSFFKENCIYMADRYVGMCSLKIKKRGYDLRLNGQFKIK